MAKKTNRRQQKDKKRRDKKVKELKRHRDRQRVIEGKKKAAQHKPLSSNAKMVKEFMEAEKVGGSYKDYVLITGNRLIDYQGSYDIMFKDGKGVGEMILVHKRKLAAILPEDFAARFWHPKLGRLGVK